MFENSKFILFVSFMHGIKLRWFDTTMSIFNTMTMIASDSEQTCWKLYWIFGTMCVECGITWPNYACIQPAGVYLLEEFRIGDWRILDKCVDEGEIRKCEYLLAICLEWTKLVTWYWKLNENRFLFIDWSKVFLKRKMIHSRNKWDPAVLSEAKFCSCEFRMDAPNTFSLSFSFSFLPPLALFLPPLASIQFFLPSFLQILHPIIPSFFFFHLTKHRLLSSPLQNIEKLRQRL